MHVDDKAGVGAMDFEYIAFNDAMAHQTVKYYSGEVGSQSWEALYRYTSIYLSNKWRRQAQ